MSLELDTISIYEDENSPEAREARGLPAFEVIDEKLEDLPSLGGEFIDTPEARGFAKDVLDSNKPAAPTTTPTTTPTVVVDTIEEDPSKGTVPLEKQTRAGGAFNDKAEIRRATPVVPPNDYKDQLAIANQSEADIKSMLNQNVAKIIATSFSQQIAQRKIALEKAMADKALAAVTAHKGAINEQLYNGLSTPDKIKADGLAQQFGLDMGEATELASNDSKIRQQAQAVLSTVIGNTAQYGAVEENLFGRFQRDPGTGEYAKDQNGKPIRIGGLIEPDNMGLVKVNDPVTFAVLVENAGALRKEQLSRATGGARDVADPMEKPLKDLIATTKDEIAAMDEGDPLRPEKKAQLQNQLASLGARQEARIAAGGGVDVPDVAGKRKALAQEQKLATINSTVEKATLGESDPTNIQSKKNDILRKQAEADGKQILKVDGVEILDKLAKIPQGDVWFYETSDGKVEAGVWEGMDSYKAKATLSPEQATEISAAIKLTNNQLRDLKTNIARKRGSAWNDGVLPANDPMVALYEKKKKELENLQRRLDVSRKLNP